MGDLLGRKVTITSELKQEKIINLKKQIRIAYYFNIKAEFFDLKRSASCDLSKYWYNQKKNRQIHRNMNTLKTDGF